MVPIGTQGTVLPYIDPTEGPLDFVWTGSVRDVATLFAKKLKSFRQAIKLNELYSLTKKHLKAHIQNFDRISAATSRSLFCSRVP